LSQVAPASQTGGQSPVSGSARKESTPSVRLSAAPDERSASPRQISPFEADRARKISDESRKPQSSVTPIASGFSSPQSSVSNLALAEPPALQEVESIAAAPEGELSIEVLRNAVLGGLENQGQRTTASMLESGEWSLEANELIVKAATTEKMIDLMVNPDVKRIAQSEASRIAGRPLKFKVLPGGTPQSATPQCATSAGNGSRTAPAGSARSRAADDPVVRRMQEKFGAEVRSVIDYRERHK
jgi:hypothetical protein